MNFSGLLDKYFIKRPRLRRFITSLLEPNRDLDVEVAGARLRINARREHGYLRASRMLRRNGTLRDEYPVLMNLFSLIRDGDVFVDVGANVGIYTHSIARLIHIYPSLKIIACEANPDTFRRLSAHHVNRVEYLNFAISDSQDELEFVDGAVSHVFTTVDKQNSYSIPNETVKVQAQRLDDLIGSEQSIVLKIDVEGQELNVLQGAKELLSKGAIRVVYLDGYDDLSVNDLLLENGFTLYDGRTLERAAGKTFSLLGIKSAQQVSGANA